MMKRTLTVAALAASACTADPIDEAPPDLMEGEVVVARQLEFAGETDGVSVGFDLDGVASVSGDGTGCGIADLVDPDGTTGIDNSFAALMPVIELAGGQALPELVQNAVLSGELLLLFEIGDEQEDGCVPLRIGRGANAPTLGTDGQILPGQTFDMDPEKPQTVLACGAWAADGSLVADDVEIHLPLAVFDETIDLTLRAGRVRIVWNEDGSSTGVIGGAVEVQEVIDNVLGFDAIPSSLVTAITSALQTRADLKNSEGVCADMSTTIAFGGAPAFLFEGEPEAGDTD